MGAREVGGGACLNGRPSALHARSRSLSRSPTHPRFLLSLSLGSLAHFSAPALQGTPLSPRSPTHALKCPASNRSSTHASPSPRSPTHAPKRPAPKSTFSQAPPSNRTPPSTSETRARRLPNSHAYRAGTDRARGSRRLPSRRLRVHHGAARCRGPEVAHCSTGGRLPCPPWRGARRGGPTVGPTVVGPTVGPMKLDAPKSADM